MKYVYTAVLEPTKNSERYYAYVPDLRGCVTSGSNLQDAIEMITDAASIWLVCAEDEGIAIPAATTTTRSTYKANSTLVEIQVDTTAYREELSDNYICDDRHTTPEYLQKVRNMTEAQLVKRHETLESNQLQAKLIHSNHKDGEWVDRDHVFCPVAQRVLDIIDCMEINDVARKIQIPHVLETFTPPIVWNEDQRKICENCKFYDM